MQTLTLDNLPTPVLLVWGLPGATDFDAPFDAIKYNGSCSLVYSQHNGHIITRASLPDGKWQLIGKLSELTEEDYKGMVHSVPYEEHRDSRREVIFNNYNSMSYKNTALESFHSAIEAEGHYITNPVPVPECVDAGPYGGGYDSKWIKEYEEAQSKTLPANTLIFKKS